MQNEKIWGFTLNLLINASVEQICRDASSGAIFPPPLLLIFHLPYWCLPISILSSPCNFCIKCVPVLQCLLTWCKNKTKQKNNKKQLTLIIQCENPDQHCQLVYSKNTAFITFHTTHLKICTADKYFSFFLFAFQTAHQSSGKGKPKVSVHQLLQK